MAEYMSIKPFGLNVIPSKTQEQVGKTVEEAIGSLWNPVLDYLSKNEDVFSGNVATEIDKLNLQTMRLGMTMDEGAQVRNLDAQF